MVYADYGHTPFLFTGGLNKVIIIYLTLSTLTYILLSAIMFLDSDNDLLCYFLTLITLAGAVYCTPIGSESNFSILIIGVVAIAAVQLISHYMLNKVDVMKIYMVSVYAYSTAYLTTIVIA